MMDDSSSKVHAESLWHMALRRFVRHKPAVIGLVALVVLVGASFSAPLFTSAGEADRITISEMRQPPSHEHLLGTDDVGRDIFLRLLFGGRISLRIGILAAVIGMTVGTVVGGVAGYTHPGWGDNLLMRLTDTLLSIPSMFILIVVGQIVGHGIVTITVIIGLFSWMRVSRLVRANVLSLKEEDFVLAARSIGAGPRRVLLRHMIPNTMAPIVVAATLGVGRAIIWEASLSFLGLGVQPPTPTWGNMLYRSQAYLTSAPWIAIFPGLTILLTVLCINFVGDGLRDALDPRTLLC